MLNVRLAKAILFAGALLTMSWIVCYETGKAVPYLRSAQSFQLRMYFLFPTLVLLLVWFSFIHRWKESGKSGYRMAMDKLATRKERIKATGLGLLGLVLIPGIFSYSSFVYLVWPAHFLSHSGYLARYRVIDVHGVSSYYELTLERASDHEEAILPVRAKVLGHHPFKSGETICLRGRSSVLGTIVDSISWDKDACR